MLGELGVGVGGRELERMWRGVYMGDGDVVKSEDGDVIFLCF